MSLCKLFIAMCGCPGGSKIGAARPLEQQSQRWAESLKEDRAAGSCRCTDAPAMRFRPRAFFRAHLEICVERSPLLLDGWSWPVVYRDASRLYEAITQGLRSWNPVGIIAAISSGWANSSRTEAQAFWREYLAGFKTPTAFPTETPETNSQHAGAGESYLEHAVDLSAESHKCAQCRRAQPASDSRHVLLAAWSLELSRQSGAGDIIFGAAFSGRPADLRGVESIVGPFVNNLPMRVAVHGEVNSANFLRECTRNRCG